MCLKPKRHVVFHLAMQFWAFGLRKEPEIGTCIINLPGVSGFMLRTTYVCILESKKITFSL